MKKIITVTEYKNLPEENFQLRRNFRQQTLEPLVQDSFRQLDAVFFARLSDHCASIGHKERIGAQRMQSNRNC